MTTFEPRTAVVTIYTGDYLDRIRHLEARAEAAEAAAAGTTRTLDEIPEYLELAEEHDALVAEAEAQALRIRVKQLPRPAWKALVAEHPAHEDVKTDVAVGVHEDTFKDALVAASIIEPAGFDPNLLGDIDFDRVYLAAFALNRGAARDPKASLVSRMIQRNAETSSSPEA